MITSLLLCAALAAAPSEPSAPPPWQETLAGVVPSVVALRVSHVRAFDTEAAGNSVATGFVVDAERGIILTNRHVVGPGPATYEVTFQNNEEVGARLLYRDPVHDFAFLRYDPAELRFLQPAALPLAPEAARVGLEIRVVGSDAGEKISFLAGTLARLDREAPNYGAGNYNDFNTFYFQAASSTSGGSSGSPVVNQRGEVVALNAGSKRQTSSSYYLPLDRVVRALRLVQSERPVPRGTVQAVFRPAPYDELRRMGLPTALEGEIRQRFPEARSLLTVAEVWPGGPAEGRLKVGDVLVKVNGELLAGFEPLDWAIDENVGRGMVVAVLRGGELREVDLPVADLHALVPASYLEVGGARLHPLSMHQARARGLAVRGLILAGSGPMWAGAGIPSGALIREINGVAVPDVKTAAGLVASRGQGGELRLRWSRLDEPERSQVAVLSVDRTWFPAQTCAQEADGTWPCKALAEAPPGRPAPSRLDYPRAPDRRARQVQRSLVEVTCGLPYRMDSMSAGRSHGVGLVVDAEEGLVAVDRDTVPSALCDARVTLGGALHLPAQVEWVHPEHNIAFLRYDPALIDGQAPRSARISTADLEQGERVWQVGITANDAMVSRRTRVGRLDPVRVELPDPPAFREINLELANPEEVTSSHGGVLLGRGGRVRALWATLPREGDELLYGMPMAPIVEALEAWRGGRAEPWPSFGVELSWLPLADALQRGLSPEEAARLGRRSPEHRRVAEVRRRAAGSPAQELLRDGDLLLSAAGDPIVRLDQLEGLAREEKVELRVLREGREQTLWLPPGKVSAASQERLLGWAGCVVQAPPSYLALQRGIPARGVYVASVAPGSPCSRAGIRPSRRIVAINGRNVADLDALGAELRGLGPGQPIRVELLDLQGRSELLTLKPDSLYWPAFELRRGPQGWARRSL